MAVTKPEDFVNNPDALKAMRKALAKLTGVPPEYIDIDVVIETRRLRARSLSQMINLIVTYAIVVTGVEVGEKLQASSLNLVESAISTSIEETLGSGFSEIVIASVVVPDIIEKTGPTQAPPTPKPSMPARLTPAPTTTSSTTTSQSPPVPQPATP